MLSSLILRKWQTESDLPDRSQISAARDRADKWANRQGLPASECAVKAARVEPINESSRNRKCQWKVRAGVFVW